MEEAIIYTEINDGQQTFKEECLFDRANMFLPEYNGMNFDDMVMVSNEYIYVPDTEEYFQVCPTDVRYMYEEVLGEQLEDNYGNGIVFYGED